MGPLETAPTDPVVTARVAWAVASAQGTGIRVFDGLLRATREAAAARYNATNLWEHRAPLAAALARLNDPRGKDLVDEVLKRGTAMSPYARMRLAVGLIALGRKEDALTLVKGVLRDAPAGAVETLVPAGEGVEWSATDVETTAETLFVLAKLGVERDAQTKLARWLVAPDQGWRSSDEDAALVRALAAYLAGHPEATRLGDVSVEVNGTRVEARPSAVADSSTARIPRELLKEGANAVTVRRTGEGEAFYSVDARVYRPAPAESTEGVRVLRRYEVKNAGGTWVELDRPVRTGEPVRCTAIAWGDDFRDAVKVVEPIPAGFEFMDDESDAQGYQEVRDGAVVHYLTNSGLPQTFRYYLRAESEGTLVALPATAEYLRRPRMRATPFPCGSSWRKGSGDGVAGPRGPRRARARRPPRAVRAPDARRPPLRVASGAHHRALDLRLLVRHLERPASEGGEVSKITGGLPVDYATISVDGRWTERARSAAAGRMLADPGGAWTRSAGIDRVPYTLVVSPAGQVAWAGYGTIRTAVLANAVRASVADRPSAGGRLYLTFDDFPAERLSDELLDVLRAEGAKATLFCIGSKAEAGKDLLRRAVREGHALGIHSWAHDGDRPELARCVAAIGHAGGTTPGLYRPPGSERVLTLTGEALALPWTIPTTTPVRASRSWCAASSSRHVRTR